MITNDRQYKIAKTQIEEFELSLRMLKSSFAGVTTIHPQLLKMQEDAILSQLKDLLEDVKEYEDLKEGRIAISSINTLRDLPLSLIKARIANGLTQVELADKAGIKMQQIQRYESEQYDSASLKTLMRIAEVLGLSINADIQIKDIPAPPSLDIKNYPFKQMFQRRWFGNFSGTYNDAVIDSRNLLERFFEVAGIGSKQYRLTKQLVRAGSNVNGYSLEAWYAQVLIKAKNQPITFVFDKAMINEAWLKTLRKLSADITNLSKIKQHLNSVGIRFIIEPHLEGTFLDGSAFLMEDNSPVIAMTLRYDRLDNFWFVLFHEIAHVLLHLSEDITIIFDDLDVKLDGIELEADRYALNALIPDEVWRKSLVRFSPSKEVIINQAKALEVHPSLVAGRIRRETAKYFQFAELIGQGDVRKQFIHELKN